MASYPETVRKIIGTMQRKNEERAHLLSVLAMWNEAQSQGYNPDDIKAFTFDVKFLDGNKWKRRQTLKELRYEFWPRSAAGHIIPQFYNCVIFHDETRHKLSPMIRKPE